jgi:hypothetical protein
LRKLVVSIDRVSQATAACCAWAWRSDAQARASSAAQTTTVIRDFVIFIMLFSPKELTYSYLL